MNSKMPCASFDHSFPTRTVFGFRVWWIGMLAETWVCWSAMLDILRWLVGHMKQYGREEVITMAPDARVTLWDIRCGCETTLTPTPTLTQTDQYKYLLTITFPWTIVLLVIASSPTPNLSMPLATMPLHTIFILYLLHDRLTLCLTIHIYIFYHTHSSIVVKSQHNVHM